jgi:hypothetical protein
VTRARRTDPATSHEAGKLASLSQGHFAVLSWLQAHGPATADEVEESWRGAWRRFSELERAGLIEPTGELRQTRFGRKARVFRYAPKEPTQGRLFAADDAGTPF